MADSNILAALLGANAGKGTGLVDSLFGPSAYDVGQARNTQDMSYAEKVARMGGFEQAKFGIGQGAAGMTRAGAGMMGMVDPLQQEAAMRESVMGMGGDLTTSAGLKAKAMQFAQAGDQRTAMKLAIAAKNMEADEAKVKLADQAEKRKEYAAKPDAEKYAMAMAKRSNLVEGTREFDDFVSEYMWDQKNKAEKKAKLSGYATQLIEEGIPEGSPEFMKRMASFNAAEITGKAKGAGTTVVMPGQEKAIDIPKFEQSVQGTIKPHLETVTAADMATAALQNSIKTGNYSSFNAAKQQLARAFSDGTISRAEVIAAGADPSMIGGIVDTTSTLFTGTPSLDTQQKMLKTLEIARKVAANKGQTALNRMKKVGEMSGLKKDQLDTLLTFPEFDGSKGSTAASDDALIKKHLKKKP